MCCGTSPITMTCYSINSSSNVSNNSGCSINCQFMVSNIQLYVERSQTKKCFSDQNQQICNFEEGNPPVVTTLHNIGRLMKKTFWLHQRICQKLLEKYLRFQEVVLLFTWWECQFQDRCRLFDFAKDFSSFFISWITSGLMNLAAHSFMKRSWASGNW